MLICVSGKDTPPRRDGLPTGSGGETVRFLPESAAAEEAQQEQHQQYHKNDPHDSRNKQHPEASRVGAVGQQISHVPGLQTWDTGRPRAGYAARLLLYEAAAW